VNVVIQAGLPKPPSWIKGESLTEWKRIVGPLDKAGLLSTLDRGVLASYCMAWEMCTDLRRCWPKKAA
jgi:P27 family predicted phage terminase small subunit